MPLWEHQISLARTSSRILLDKHIVYLNFEMRVGKTLTAFEVCKIIGAVNVLVVTKKKAIGSIMDDYEREGYKFELLVTNYEQCPKLKSIYDVVIVDEANMVGAYPKPSERAKNLKRIAGKNYLIFLSGTPSPESYSQLYHQFWISSYSPFAQDNFYKWAKEFVKVKQKVFSGVRHNDYSDADKDKIWGIVEKYFVTYTQEQAKFKQGSIIEAIKYVEVDPRIFILVDIVNKKGYYKFKNGDEIVADSAVKKQSKTLQIFSGTVKTETGSVVLDDSKVRYILKHYSGMKVAIFYKFITEGKLLRQMIPNWTNSPEEFNSSDKWYVGQILSGSMGTNLETADVILFYNIDFSYLQYKQATARHQNMRRDKPAFVHWIFSHGGIEEKVYKTVVAKKSYTNFYYQRDYLK